MSGTWFTYGGTGSSITVTHTAGHLRLTGTVNNYAGFGMTLDTCTDASSYAGISFDVGGSVGSMGQALLQVRTLSNTPASYDDRGQCSTDCGNNQSVYSMPSAAGTVSVAWSALRDGTPVSPADPTEVLGFQWQFQCPTDGACALDVTLDNLSFSN